MLSCLRFLFAVTTLFVLAAPQSALAWSLRTHLWIGQQVLNDALDDGHVTIDGREYALPDHVIQALRAEGDRYLMGHFGPDVFPDPIVGQTTTHPGIVGGWQTDRWLSHLLENADSPGEIAFAYGFAGHASGDIFAHTYVNAFSGSVFDLSSSASDRVVETRHFVLEKYIEAHTPPVIDQNNNVLSLASLETSTSFVRDYLILNSSTAAQYSRVPTAAHILSMHEIRKAVGNAKREYEDVKNLLGEWGGDFFRLKAQLDADILSGQIAIDAARGALEAERTQLQIKADAHEFALNRLSEARDIINRNPELITHNVTLLSEQTVVAANAAAEAAEGLSRLNREIDNLNSSLRDIRDKIDDWTGVGVVCRLTDWCKDRDKLEDQISLRQERKELLTKLSRDASTLRDNISIELDRLKSELDTATRNIANGTYQAAVDLSRCELSAQQGLYSEKERLLNQLEDTQRDLSERLSEVTDITTVIEAAISSFDPVTLVLENWESDINRATGKYVDASHRVGLMIASNSGEPAREYLEWWGCYGAVFMGVPSEIGETSCAVRGYLGELNEGVDEAINELPEILRWAITPIREVKRVVKRELEREIKAAGEDLLVFITSPSTAEFLLLISSPESADKEKLVSVFRTDESRLDLLTFEDVSQLVDKDMDLQNGMFNPGSFAPVAHSVTMAKLALLGPSQLNEMIHDYVGDYQSPTYGYPLYPVDYKNFTVLTGAVRSIDGNHQWQAYGLPYPRRSGSPDNPSRDHLYGYDYRDDKRLGFRLWVDPYVRERVFLRLFPGEIVGQLSSRHELQWPKYRFPSCPANPFPSTQNSSGNLVTADRRCLDLAYPDASILDREFSDRDEHHGLFHRCAEPSTDQHYSVVVSSHPTQASAHSREALLSQAFPDMYFDVESRSRVYAVVAGACLDLEYARRALDVVRSRRIAHDAYILPAVHTPASSHIASE